MARRIEPITQFYLAPMFIHEWNEPSRLSSRPQSITAIWLVLISRPTEGRRLSCTAARSVCRRRVIVADQSAQSLTDQLTVCSGSGQLTLKVTQGHPK